MKQELQSWNNGKGVDLPSWIGAEGSYALAVGYSTVFCPTFEKYEGYIFRTDGEINKDFIDRVKSFNSQEGATRQSVEQVMNHLHLDSI